MPGTTNVSANIKELEHLNNTPGRHRPQKQIIAIAESQARKASGKHSAHEHHAHEGFHRGMK